jgi:hypothetical protein
MKKKVIRVAHTGNIFLGYGNYKLCIFPDKKAARLHLGKKTYHFGNW